MKTILIAASLLVTTSAFAAEQSKGEASAEFRMKVATCKATAKTDGVKTNSPDFYSYMGGCLDRVHVAVNVDGAK